MENEEIRGNDSIVTEEHARLITSPHFKRSPVLTGLLNYLVEHRLKGGRATPKAYAIATEALGRDADFDPAVDSYPRVMVGRLRQLLDRYYSENPGPHRLSVPHGSYEIVVEKGKNPSDAIASGGAQAESGSSVQTVGGVRHAVTGHWWNGFNTIFLALLLFVLAGGAIWWLNESPQSPLSNTLVPVPTIEIIPPSSGNTAVSKAVSRGLEAKLRDGLRRFDAIQLQSNRDVMAGEPKHAPDFRLDSSVVLTVDGPVDVTLVLNRVSDQRTIWSQQIRFTQAEIPSFTAIEPAISQIAGDYGVIVEDQLARQPDNYAPGYPCFAQFNRVRQMRTETTTAAVAKCLRDSVKRDQTNATLLSALSLLRFSDWQKHQSTLDGKAAYLEAQGLASRANDAGPNTAVGLFALARAKFYSGNCEQGVAIGNLALKRNPLDADMTGFLGLFEVACGEHDKAQDLLEKSLWLDDSHAGIPAVTLAFLLSQRKENDEALAILNRMPSPSNLEPQYIMVKAVILARKGEMKEAQKLWARLLAYTKQPYDADPEMVLRQFMISPIVIKRAAAAVRAAGLSGQPPAP